MRHDYGLIAMGTSAGQLYVIDDNETQILDSSRDR